MRKKSVCLRFFAPLRGLRVSASNSGVATLRNFHRPQARENACWGAPQTRRTSGHFVQKSLVVCGPELSLLGLIFTPIRMAEQMVNVRLDRHGLPHFRLGLAVFRIKGLSLFGELPALLFQRIHFRDLRPA